MAWPFADKRHGVEACVVRYERSRACMEPWRREEQKVAVLLLVVPVAVFLWKVNAFQPRPRILASQLCHVS